MPVTVLFYAPPLTLSGGRGLCPLRVSQLFQIIVLYKLNVGFVNKNNLPVESSVAEF